MNDMRALVKSRPEPGLWLEDVPVPEIGINDVLIKVDETGICGTDVHIYKWDAWAAEDDPRADGRRPRVRRRDRRGRRQRHRLPRRRNRQRRRATSSAAAAATAWPAAAICAATRRASASTGPGAFAEYIALPHDQRLGPCPGDRSDDVAAIFDPFGNAVHTALSFDLLGEDVLITGAGPIGIMARRRSRSTPGRATSSSPTSIRIAWSWRSKMGVDARRRRPHDEDLADVQKELGMKEGFDVGLEMSGNRAAFRDMLANMAHGGKIAMLGIPDKEMAIDWNTVIFNMLTIKGIYGREMYETWYKMTVMLQAGLDIARSSRTACPPAIREGFAAMRSGNSGKVVLDWT